MYEEQEIVSKTYLASKGWRRIFGLQVVIRTRHPDIHYVVAVVAVRNRFQAGLPAGFQRFVLEGPLLSM